jgi:hypothetical protein
VCRDIRVEIEDMVAEGDVVAARLTFGGTHAPSGERAMWPEMIFACFSGGKGRGELGGDGHRARLGQPALVEPSRLHATKFG